MLMKNINTFGFVFQGLIVRLRNNVHLSLNLSKMAEVTLFELRAVLGVSFANTSAFSMFATYSTS